MISGAIRAARGLLGWTRHELARRAVVSDATVYALETARGMIANKSTLAIRSTRRSRRQASSSLTAPRQGCGYIQMGCVDLGEVRRAYL